MDQNCPFHTDHENRIARNGSDIQDLWRLTSNMDSKREEAVRRIHERIDNLKNMFIATMLTFIVQCVAVIGYIVVELIKKG